LLSRAIAARMVVSSSAITVPSVNAVNTTPPKVASALA
jgi:hypothetical protein